MLYITDEELDNEINRTYNEALPNASFRNGFKSGFRFAKKEVLAYGNIKIHTPNDNPQGVNLSSIYLEKIEEFVLESMNKTKKADTNKGVEVEAKAISTPKPPIGLMPKKIHDDFVKEKRAKEILQAISRYQENGFEAKKEWFIELCELNRSLYGSK